MTWFWNYGITVTEIPEGREGAVAEAFDGVLPLRDVRTGLQWVRGEGGEALPTRAEPGEIALDLAEAAQRAAGCRVPVRVVFESCESVNDEGHSLDETPLKEYFFAGAAAVGAGTGSREAIEVDEAGHRYIELEMSDAERIRVTCAPDSDSAGGGPTLRIQKRARTARLSPGIELPVGKTGRLIAAVQALTSATG